MNIYVDDPQTKTRGDVRYNTLIHNIRKNCEILSVNRNQQSIQCGFKISNVLEYRSLILSFARSLGILHSDASIFIIFVTGQTQRFLEHTLTVKVYWGYSVTIGDKR